MTRQIADAELRAYSPGESTPFVTLSDSITGLNITESAQVAIDSGSIEIENTDGVISDATRITSGDRLEFLTKLTGESSLSTRFVALARDVTDTLEGGDVRRVSIELTDFVFSVLSFRTADGAFEAVDVGTIADTLVGAEASEIGRSQIDTVGTDATLTVSGRVLLDVLQSDLAPEGDAVIAGDGTDLVFRALDDVGIKHDLTPADLRAPIDVKRVDDELINRVRIDGGIDTALDDEQPTQSATTRVDNSTRETVQIQTRKSEVGAIDVYTLPDSTANAGLTVRLQAARSGSAVDPADTESDIARRKLAPAFLADDGFTRFELPDHDLAPAEDPFAIIEGAGSTGHDVGTDGSGNVTYRSFHPFPLLARAEAGDSQSEYRRRDRRRRDSQLGSEQAVQDAAQAMLRHRSEPKRRLTAGANSTRAHTLAPGEAVRLADFSVSDVSGTFLVTERRTNYDGSLLRTELTLADTATI